MNEILTERIKLRLIEISDLDSIHQLHSLPETDEFNALGIPKNIEETKNLIDPWIVENKLSKIKNYTFAIENRLNKKFIGLFGLKFLLPLTFQIVFGPGKSIFLSFVTHPVSI